MMFQIRIVQLVGIDVDLEHGEEPGDGAARIQLAVLELDLELPFAPVPGLSIQHQGFEVRLEDVVWNHDEGTFLGHGEDIWTLTEDAAQGIVHALIEAGFCPLDPNHREAKVH